MSDLDAEVFGSVINAAPLVAIDLLVEDGVGRLLMGLRINEPAAGRWFVPGGRIRKGETLDAAFTRIAAHELGAGDWVLADAAFDGVRTHQYEGNALGLHDVSTHYVVLAYRLGAVPEVDPPLDQHEAYRWIGADEIDELGDVGHPNAVAYVAGPSRDDPREMTHHQYALLNGRRDVANNLVWQTPVVSMTGLAFLFSVLLAGDTSPTGRWIAALLAVLTCLASLHLSAKQRFNEATAARMAQAYEDHHRMFRMNGHRRPGSWIVRRSAVRLWKALYVCYGVAAIVAAVLLS